MTRSKGGGKLPIFEAGIVLILAAVVVAVFFPGILGAGEAEKDTDTGQGIQQTFDNSQSVAVTLSVTDCAKPATAFSAADTIWLIKDSTTGVWMLKETDTNNSTPSVSLSPGTEYKALTYDDTTGYGKITTGTVPYQAVDPKAVCLDTIDTAPVLTLFRADDGQKMTSTNVEPVTSENQSFDLIQYRISVADYKAYNKPIMCFDYNFTNVSDAYVRSASGATTPRYLLGTAEGCWNVNAPTPGTPSSGYIYVKLNKMGVGNVTIPVYLADQQYFQNTDTGDFDIAANINDVSTNVGDSTDATVAGNMYFEKTS